jgi:hypothetical protein
MVAVKALHLGTYQFKGADPVDMVSVAAAALVGRAALLPRAEVKGKARRVTERSGEADSAEAPLPDVLPRLRDSFVYAAASYGAAAAAAAAAATAAAAAAPDAGGDAGGRRGDAGGRRGGRSGKRGRNSAAVAAAAAAAVDYAAWLSRHAARRAASPPAPAGGAAASPRAGRAPGRSPFGF